MKNIIKSALLLIATSMFIVGCGNNGNKTQTKGGALGSNAAEKSVRSSR